MDCMIDVERLYDSTEFKRIEQIQSQNKQSEFHQWLWSRYNNHETWLRRAIKDLGRGDRLAFGAKLYNRKIQTPIIIGSIIIKKEDYYDDKVAELKNLVVDERALELVLMDKDLDEIERDYNNSEVTASQNKRNEKSLYVKGVWKRIISKVDGFCTRRGFKRIVFEVPFDQKELIQIFDEMGFIIARTKQSNYQSGDLIYRMSKILPQSYSGDPFFVKQMGRWFVEEHLEYKFIESDFQGIKDRWRCEDFDTQELLDDTEIRHFSFSKSKQTSDQNKFSLIGKLIVIDDWYINNEKTYPPDNNPVEIKPSIIRYLIDDSNFHIILTYYEHKALRQSCDRIGIKYLSRQKDKILFGKDSTTNAISFSRKDIAGITLVVGNDFLADCMDKIPDGKEYIFYLNGSTGACISDAENKNFIVFYYTPFSKEFEGKPGIWGYSYLLKQAYSDSALNPVTKIKDRLKSEQLGKTVYFEPFDFFDTKKNNCERYKKLIKYNEDGPIVSLILTKPQPIHKKTCFLLESILGKNNPYFKYLVSENIIFSDFYINKNMRDNFRKNIKEETKANTERSDHTKLETDSRTMHEKGLHISGGNFFNAKQVVIMGRGEKMEFRGGQHASKQVFIENFVLGDSIRSVEYKKTDKFTEEQFDSVLSALRSLPEERTDDLKQMANTILDNQNPSSALLEKFKEFINKHAGPVAEGITASTMFEIFKSILF